MTLNRTAIAVSAAAAIAATIGLYIRPAPEVISAPQAAKSAIRSARTEIDPIRDAAAPVTLSAGAHRNLFTFNDAPPPRIQPRVTAAPLKFEPPPAVVAAVQQPQADAVPQPPPLPYRCIGRFGPDAAPFVALANDDHEIVNARAGETVGGRFIIRSIGVDAVDIGFVGFPSSADKRIAIGH